MQSRRQFLKTTSWTALGLAVAAGWLRPSEALAEDWNQAAFEAKSVPDVLKALGLAGPPKQSDAITLTAPDIAENGAVVPISVASTLSDVKRIAILIEKNPSTLAAQFTLLPGADPAITTRVKVGQSTDVYGLVLAGDQLYFTKKEVKVTLGGCGG
ncbi:MAG: thiosulfate oxidation carrier protein SoxY [Pseudomonadota bacterium]|nr:thiosulfate oxidation carrier protein SoxY [Pseudomonadota bacterium]